MMARRVLVVDDEPGLCHLIQRYLARAGYEVEIAASGEEAWDTITASANGFDIYLIDMTLPNMPGDELAERLIHRNPAAKVILTSGYELGPSTRQVNTPRIGFLQKPYPPARLVESLRVLANQ